MHSLLARELATTVVRDRVSVAARLRARAAKPVTGCGCEIDSVGPALTARPVQTRTCEAEPVSV